MPVNVAVLVGSLRAGSFNRSVADAIAELAAPKLALKRIEIGDLPFYNEDQEKNPPNNGCGSARKSARCRRCCS